MSGATASGMEVAEPPSHGAEEHELGDHESVPSERPVGIQVLRSLEHELSQQWVIYPLTQGGST